MARGIWGSRWQLRGEMKKCKAVKDERPKDARSTRKIKPFPGSLPVLCPLDESP